MATTTASLTLTSADLFEDNLSISTSNALNKAGTTIGLDQTTGLNRVYLTATTNVDIFTVPGATKDGKKSHVYIANLSTAISLDKPAINGLHNIALDFVLEQRNKGKDALDIYNELIKGELKCQAQMKQ